MGADKFGAATEPMVTLVAFMVRLCQTFAGLV